MAALVGSAALSTPAAQADQGLPGRIAYASDDALIHTIEGDGTRLKTAFDRVTGAEWSALKLRDPAYSPDGHKLVFTGESADATRIGVVEDGKVVTVAQSTAAIKALQQPAFSADGKKVVFRALGADWGLYTVSAAGGSPAKIALENREPAEPAYSPDGRLLAFSALDANGDRRVYLKNLETEQVTQLTSGGAGQAFPAFSPDSANVAYMNIPLATGGGNGPAQIAVRPVAGGAQDILWSDTTSLLGRPAYSPDGKRVAFTKAKPAGEPCAAELTVIDTDGAPNPRAIACASSTVGGSVDWAVRTSQGIVKLASALPGSERESGNGDTTSAAIAGSGRFEVFASTATNLTSGTDDNDKSDVFVRDLVSGATDLVSADTDDRFPSGTSDDPIISADGQYVAFRSDARDVLAGFEGGTTAVYLRTLGRDPVTELASRSQGRDHIGAAGSNRPLALSEDGRYTLFASTDDELLGDPQGENGDDHDVDLFRWDRFTNKTDIVTVKAGTLQQAGNGGAGRAYLSADGNTVVFESTATDLVAGFVDHNGAEAASVFKRDLAAGTTTLVDGKNATETSDQPSELRGLSPDGKTVLFASNASDLIEHFVDGNGDGADLYTRRTGPATLVTTSGVAADHGANAPVGAATLTNDRVVFTSKATDLNGEYTTTGDQVWMSTGNGPATLVTRGLELNHGANGDSTLIDAADTQVLVRSNATDLSAPLKQHDGAPALYRIDTATFDAEPVSARGDDSNDAAPDQADISDDGNTVAWSSRAANLVSDFIDGNGADGGDAFAWIERKTAAQDPLKPTIEIKTPVEDALYRQDRPVLADYECADEGPSGLASCEGSVPAGTPLDFSDTGSFTFKVTARDNAGNETTKSIDYRVAAPNRKLSLASRSRTDRLTTADGESDGAVFSADGRYLVFTSAATDLVAGFIDGNGSDRDVYRRDLNTGVTELVSAGLPRAGDDGRPRGANDQSETDPTPRAISPDGRYVLFESDATNLIAGMTSPFGTQLYVRDMQQGVTTLVTHSPSGLPGGDAEPNQYQFSRDGKTVVFVASADRLVADDRNGNSDVFTYSMTTGAVTLVSAEATGAFPANGSSWFPAISADGRKVVFSSNAANIVSPALENAKEHVYWRDLDTGVTKLVDRKWDKNEPANGTSRESALSADGKLVLFATDAPEIVESYAGHGDDQALQLYLRDMTTGAPATLVTSAWDNPKRGTGIGDFEDARFSGDGSTVVWNSFSHGVVENFVDENTEYHNYGIDAEDLFVRRFDGGTPVGKPALAAHSSLGVNHGVDFPDLVKSLSDDGRFAAIYVPTSFCDQCREEHEDVYRLDLKRNRFNSVITEGDEKITRVSASDDGRRIAAETAAVNLLDGFVDANEPWNSDVFAWYDAPPTAVAESRVTGSLKLAFDASDSADSDGRMERFEWDFGDGHTGEGEQVEHTYDEEKGYTVKLTIEDDGGNEVSTTTEIVALKGILTTGAKPIDFIGVDKHLRCSVIRDGALFAKGGGDCGTFVALDGKTYGPPELIDGTTDYTPVSQALTTAGDTTTLVTVVALGETGAKLRQTDAYIAGKAWYRTDVELLDTTKPATVYRGVALRDGRARARCTTPGPRWPAVAVRHARSRRGCR